MEENYFEEISYNDIQGMVDKLLGQNRFSFGEYVGKLMQGSVPFSNQEFINNVVGGVLGNINQDRKIYISIFIIAIVGAILGNFSYLLQGKEVADTAFFAVYLLFFSVLMTGFSQTTALAEETLTGLLDFMKVLTPTYFMTMTFSQSAVSAGVYYQFTLVMITMVNLVLVKIVLPCIHIFFLLKIANEISKKDLFSRMAELIRDVTKFLMKTLFGVMMGINVIQGLLLPVASKMENTILIRAASAIPGVGNTVSSVTSTVLCAGTLVKNAVGVTGVIVVIVYCGIPIIQLVIVKFLYQFINAVIQPVSDKRINSCLAGMTEALGLLMYALLVGTMMFVLAITIMSAMTGGNV